MSLCENVNHIAVGVDLHTLLDGSDIPIEPLPLVFEFVQVLHIAFNLTETLFRLLCMLHQLTESFVILPLLVYPFLGRLNSIFQDLSLFNQKPFIRRFLIQLNIVVVFGGALACFPDSIKELAASLASCEVVLEGYRRHWLLAITRRSILLGQLLGFVAHVLLATPLNRVV